jgi:hypothetical protein
MRSGKGSAPGIRRPSPSEPNPLRPDRRTGPVARRPRGRLRISLDWQLCAFPPRFMLIEPSADEQRPNIAELPKHPEISIYIATYEAICGECLIGVQQRWRLALAAGTRLLGRLHKPSESHVPGPIERQIGPPCRADLTSSRQARFGGPSSTPAQAVPRRPSQATLGSDAPELGGTCGAPDHRNIPFRAAGRRVISLILLGKRCTGRM